MYFYLIGIDYKIAPLGIREYFYHRRCQIIDFWRTKETAILFTCNRIEIYAVSNNTDAAFGYIAKFSRVFPDFLRYAYLKYGEKQVFQHALRLACGLESQLQGELQILQQLGNWQRQGHLPFALDGLWKKVLSLATDIRAQSGLDDDRNNIAAVVYADLGKYLKPSKPLKIIVVGTGKIAGLLARYRQPWMQLNFVAHKNYDRAKDLARIAQGEAFLLKDLTLLLSKADVLISASSSPHYVLKQQDFINAYRPFYIYDLALPRDIEPAVADLPDIFSQSLYDLTATIHYFNQRNQEHIYFASRLIKEILQDYPRVAYAQNY